VCASHSASVAKCGMQSVPSGRSWRAHAGTCSLVNRWQYAAKAARCWSGAKSEPRVYPGMLILFSRLAGVHVPSTVGAFGQLEIVALRLEVLDP